MSVKTCVETTMRVKPVFGILALLVAGYTFVVMHRMSWQVVPAGDKSDRKLKMMVAEVIQSEYGSHHGATLDFQKPFLQDGLTKEEFQLDQVDDESDERREAIRDAMRFAWGAYDKYAFGMDELMPVSKKGQNNFGGLGATIIDALDSLWLFGMKEEFKKCQKWVADELNFDKAVRLSLFETNIRIVGGLLGAYELSGERMFLQKAQDLVDRVVQAFNSTTGIPYNFVRLPRMRITKATAAGTAALAELGTFGLEFDILTQRTGRPEYSTIADKIYHVLGDANQHEGLLSVRINRRTGKAFSSRVHLTVGAMADSYYEYLLKMWLLRNKTDEFYRQQWILAMDGMCDKLLMRTASGELTYVGEVKTKVRYSSNHAPQVIPVTRMEELSCYVPGNLALGVITGAVNGTRAKRYTEVAKNLTYTCVQMYQRMPTGLAAEDVWMNGTADSEMVAHQKFNLIRPETIESLWYLFRLTGNRRYQEWGWEIFEAIERFSRTEAGYTGLKDVTVVPPEHDDQMQSFFLAETLKYLYLLFSPPSFFDFNEWVLNTEAHLMRIKPKAGGLQVS